MSLGRNQRICVVDLPGMVGEKCDVFCKGDASMNTAHIICLSSGAWDKDTADICRLRREYGNFYVIVVYNDLVC